MVEKTPFQRKKEMRGISVSRCGQNTINEKGDWRVEKGSIKK